MWVGGNSTEIGRWGFGILAGVPDRFDLRDRTLDARSPVIAEEFYRHMTQFPSKAGCGFAIPMDMGIGNSRKGGALGVVGGRGGFKSEQIYHNCPRTIHRWIPKGQIRDSPQLLFKL
jgi:hypothetical protein